jgi:hypothetical protein
VTSLQPTADAEEGSSRWLISASDLPGVERWLEGIIKAELPDGQKRKDVAKKWLDTVKDTVSTGIVPLDAVIKATVTIVAEEALSSRAHRGAMEWWGQRELGNHGTPVERLVTLTRWFRQGGDDRTEAEALLVDALFEDVRRHYNRLRSANGKPHPLVLLDNAHCPEGRHLLRLFRRALQHATAQQPSRLVVLAASLGDRQDSVGPNAVAMSVPAPSAATAHGLLRIGTPPLTLPHVRHMLGGVDAPAGTANLILRLSGGRGLVAATLARSVVRRLASGRNASVELDRLWDLPASESGGTVAGLLEQLVPDAEARKRLRIFCSALDSEADGIGRSFLPGAQDALAWNETKTYLEEEHWPQEPWPGLQGPYVGDRTLRSLLLHRLSASQDGLWQQLHLWLRDRYDDRSLTRHEKQYLHHSLALGDVEVVVHHLHAQFSDGNAEQWLRVLNVVCAAPRPPARGPRDDALPDCLSCRPDVVPVVHQAIHGLVTALWEHSQPLAVPDQNTVRKVQFALSTLAQNSSGPAAEIFFRAHYGWPDLLLHWQQAPDLPIPGETRT